MTIEEIAKNMFFKQNVNLSNFMRNGETLTVSHDILNDKLIFNFKGKICLRMQETFPYNTKRFNEKLIATKTSLFKVLEYEKIEEREEKIPDIWKIEQLLISAIEKFNGR